ncbi:MAG: hypothetical protein ABSA78_08715 [Candidatus Sulfotelmatobacter sp.]|jgi:hypothetical protein
MMSGEYSAVTQASAIQPDPKSASSLTGEDRAILDTVEQYLAAGLALKNWWKDAGLRGQKEQTFTLERSFNRATNSYGFFSQAQVQDRTVAIMGNVQDMLFDRAKRPPHMVKQDTEWTRRQLREFVLRYFMRVSSFRAPEAAVDDDGSAVSSWLSGISWCPAPDVVREGFGFSQLYYKSVAGEVGKFSDTSAIVDMREIGEKYEWIVLKVRIFNLTVPVRPFGTAGPELPFNLNEESYLVVSREFILDRDRPAPGTLAEYGVGYAFIKSPKTKFLAFGPGEFAMAIELIEFQMAESGDIHVHIVFVVNRPEAIANLTLDPVDWSLRLANLLSLGMASSLLDPLRAAVSRLPLRLGTFDPVYSYIGLMKLLTDGLSEEKLCISKAQLDKRFLLQHFLQHYETLAGALFTWRQIPDWLDSAALPRWVVTGRSS